MKKKKVLSLLLAVAMVFVFTGSVAAVDGEMTIGHVDHDHEHGVATGDDIGIDVTWEWGVNTFADTEWEWGPNPGASGLIIVDEPVVSTFAVGCAHPPEIAPGSEKIVGYTNTTSYSHMVHCEAIGVCRICNIIWTVNRNYAESHARPTTSTVKVPLTSTTCSYIKTVTSAVNCVCGYTSPGSSTPSSGPSHRIGVDGKCVSCGYNSNVVINSNENHDE